MLYSTCMVLRHSSRLRIENAVVNDTGSYRCFAVNTVGRSRLKRTRVVVAAVTSSCPSDSQPCEDQSYCLNDGLCCQIDQLAVRLCQWVFHISDRKFKISLAHIFSFGWVDFKILVIISDFFLTVDYRTAEQFEWWITVDCVDIC